jgi:hypothetical protein
MRNLLWSQSLKGAPGGMSKASPEGRSTRSINDPDSADAAMLV